MKFSCSSFFAGSIILFIIGVNGQQRKDRWSIRRPLQVITSKLSRRPIPSSLTAQGHQQFKYINLSEQRGIFPNGFSTSPDLQVGSSAERLKGDFPSSSGQLFIDKENGEHQWEGPQVKKVSNAGGAAHSRHSSLISTAVAPIINHVYSRVPAVALYEAPIFEQDSYLEALQLSRLPCQLLKDPDNCFDSTQLFRQRHKDDVKEDAPASKKLLATIRILINFHEKYHHRNTLA